MGETKALVQAEWRTIVGPGARSDTDQLPTVPVRHVLLQILVATAVVVAVIGIVGTLVSRRAAEQEAVHRAAEITDVVASSVLQPALTDAAATDPAAARAALERVRPQVEGIVRTKLWNAAGTIVYSDEPRLVGRSYPLDEDTLEVFRRPQTRAEVSDLSGPENEFERGHGKLLEVYRPVWTPDGTPLIYEVYYRYDVVAARAGQLWRGFAGITLSSIAAVIVLLGPLVWTLVDRARRAQRQRERLLARAADASQEERRRIAATLHDGAVQELAAAAFAVAAAASRTKDPAVAGQLAESAQAVRTALAGLRSLLVDIYPPTLQSAGLAETLRDLTGTLAGRDVVAHTDIDDEAADALSPSAQEAVFRVAQEAVRNAVAHARGSRIDLSLRREGDGVRLEVRDDGAGFDAAAVLAAPEAGHFGLHLMTDAARSVGARLDVRSAPGRGTTWRMDLP